MRTVFSDLYPITNFYPDFNWIAMVRIEYLSLFFIMIFALALINALYKELGSVLFMYLMIGINILFIVFVVASKPFLFTRWLPLYLTSAVIILLYGVITITRAIILEKTGGWLLIVGVIFFILLSGYNIIAYEGLWGANQFIMSVGYIIVFLFVSGGLLQHLNIIKTKPTFATTFTYKDFFKDN